MAVRKGRKTQENKCPRDLLIKDVTIIDLTNREMLITFSNGEQKTLNIKKFIDVANPYEPLDRLLDDIELFKSFEFGDSMIWWDDETDVSVCGIYNNC